MTLKLLKGLIQSPDGENILFVVSLSPCKTKYKTKYITQSHARGELKNVERQNLEKINHFQCKLGLFGQLCLQVFTETQTKEGFLSSIMVALISIVTLFSLVVSVHFIRTLTVLLAGLPLQLEVKISFVDLSRTGAQTLFLVVVGGSIAPDPRHGGDGGVWSLTTGNML